jgi:hypothetical protein
MLRHFPCLKRITLKAQRVAWFGLLSKVEIIHVRVCSGSWDVAWQLELETHITDVTNLILVCFNNIQGVVSTGIVFADLI